MQFTTVLTFVGISLLAASGVQAGNYGATCSNTRLQGDSLMFADCENRIRTKKSVTSLDLNNCIVNRGGTLKCEANGKYSASCSGCSVSNTMLSCKCDGQPAKINLNFCVTNRDGLLSCS